MNLVIGLGGAGKNTLDQILPGLRVSGVDYLYINTDAEAIKAVEVKHRFALDEVDISVSRRKFEPVIQSSLAERVSGFRRCFVICGLGGSCANAIPALLQTLDGCGVSVHLLVYSPFTFEGDRVRRSFFQLHALVPILMKVTAYKNIALETHPYRDRKESLIKFFERIAIEIELYIHRNIGDWRQ